MHILDHLVLECFALVYVMKEIEGSHIGSCAAVWVKNVVGVSINKDATLSNFRRSGKSLWGDRRS